MLISMEHAIKDGSLSESEHQDIIFAFYNGATEVTQWDGLHKLDKLLCIDVCLSLFAVKLIEDPLTNFPGRVRLLYVSENIERIKNTGNYKNDGNIDPKKVHLNEM